MHRLLILCQSTLAVLLLSACGAGTTPTEERGQISDQPHLQERLFISNYNKDDAEASYHIDETAQKITFSVKNLKSDPSQRHIQIYIDIDNNPRTGYNTFGESRTGAEYLIEDDAIYSYSGNGDMDWQWSRLADLEEHISEHYGTYIRSVEVDKSLLPQMQEHFMTKSVIFEPDWITAVYTRNADYISVAEKEFVADLLRGPGNIPYQTKLYENGHALIFESSLSNGDNVNIRVHRQYFIDIDNNSDTGYGEGYEYLLEDGIVSKYTGGDGTWEWSWEDVGQGFVTGLSAKSTSVFLKSALPFMQPTIRIKSVLNSRQWTQIYAQTEEVTITLPQTIRRDYDIKVSAPDDDRIQYGWKTLFTDIIGERGYALNRFGGSVGSIHYRYGSYLTTFDLQDYENPEPLDYLYLGDDMKALDMVTTPQFIYIVCEKSPRGMRPVGTLLKIVKIEEDHTVLISEISLFGGPASHLTVEKVQERIVVHDDRHDVTVDVSDPYHPVKI